MASIASNLRGEVFDLKIPVQSSALPSTWAKKIEKNPGFLDCPSDRLVTFFVPESVRGKSEVPLLIAFHGSTETGPIFRTRTTAYGYDQLACELGFIVAYPTGFKGNWNDSRQAVCYPAKLENIDDVSFTKLIIEYASQPWHTSPQRTFIVGYSNGGHMCYRLALELGSNFIAGVGIHCANLPSEDNSDCSPIPSDAVPICIINGTLDPVNPWGGGEVCLNQAASPGASIGSRGSHRSAIETSDYFATRVLDLGQELELEEIEDEDEVKDIRQFRNPENGRVLVKLMAMIGEGHYVPVAAGRKKGLVIGPRRGAVNAPREVLRFFQQSTSCFKDNLLENEF